MRPRAKTGPQPRQQAHSAQTKCLSSMRQHSVAHGHGHGHGCHAPRPSRASSLPIRPSLAPPVTAQRGAAPDDAAPHTLHVFLALPEKVRKLHYSRAEQALLLARCQHACPQRDGDLERARQHFSDFRFGFAKDPYQPRALGPPSPCLSDTSSAASATPPCICPSAHEQDEAESTLFHLDMTTPTSSTRPTPAHAARRTMSLTTSSMHSLSSPAGLQRPPSAWPATPSPLHQRAQSSSLPGRRSLHTPIPPIFDAEATHYSDPEARKKLRTFLASPQKFDEAIEFGFPSTAAQASLAPRFQLPAIASHSRKFSRDMHSFLRHGKLSFFDDARSGNQGLESDVESVPDSDSPATPSSTRHSFRLHARQISHAKLANDHVPGPFPIHSHTGPVNREMTLRMTLTRPDLRADDDHLYGWQAPDPKPLKDDPLALEDLVFSDDMTGTQGAFYVKPKPRGNLVTRMLKRASHKSR
ncbi:hypothetical protein ACEQ8H_005194 [Pleosporales sp. CAS-2024a]